MEECMFKKINRVAKGLKLPACFVEALHRQSGLPAEMTPEQEWDFYTLLKFWSEVWLNQRMLAIQLDHFTTHEREVLAKLAEPKQKPWQQIVAEVYRYYYEHQDMVTLDWARAEIEKRLMAEFRDEFPLRFMSYGFRKAEMEKIRRSAAQIVRNNNKRGK